MSTDPASVERILAGLASGRQKAVERAQAQGAVTARAVRRAFDVDKLEGHAERGRAGRLARRLRRDGIAISERHVRRILAGLSACPIHSGNLPPS